MEPFFSVIIPLYNKEDYIQNTLKSVLNQTFKDIEIIIVNDGSTDNSLKAISTFKDERIILLEQKNGGASMARNNGIAKSNGNYIALLDADDIWLENHLIELKKLINQFPTVGLYCTNYEVKRHKNTIIPASFNFTYLKNCIIIENFFEANTIDCIPTSSSSAFLKKNFNELGGYNISIPSGQDTDLWIRFGLNFSIAFNPKITMLYNNYDNSSLSKSKYNLGRYQLINQYKDIEKANPSLKLYLDINRHALAIRCLLNNEDDLYSRAKKEIDFKNLNFKQKLLLGCPKCILKLAKEFHRVLVKNGIYFSANI